MGYYNNEIKALNGRGGWPQLSHGKKPGQVRPNGNPLDRKEL